MCFGAVGVKFDNDGELVFWFSFASWVYDSGHKNDKRRTASLEMLGVFGNPVNDFGLEY